MNTKITFSSTSFMLFSIAFFLLYFPTLITASSNVTALFAFGDSTLDSGNNNQLVTLFRSDHPPYGKDFPNAVATGRFSNGKLSTDFVVSSLGLKDLLPAYLDPKLTDKDLLTGVSFASAGTGLDYITADLASALKMSQQLDYFDQALKRIKALVGEEKAKFIVANAIFVFSIGTNDIAYNFYVLPTRKIQFSLPEYHDFLQLKLKSAIQKLYNAGARRFAVAGLPPIGCLPAQAILGNITTGQHMIKRACIEQHNTDSIAYNKKLQALTRRLQVNVLKGSKIAYMDMYNPMMDMIKNPSKYGFEKTLQGCCGIGLLEMGPLCNKIEPTYCPNASKYIFWDAVHPTEVTYWNLAQVILRTAIAYLTG